MAYIVFIEFKVLNMLNLKTRGSLNSFLKEDASVREGIHVQLKRGCCIFHLVYKRALIILFIAYQGGKKVSFTACPFGQAVASMY